MRKFLAAIAVLTMAACGGGGSSGSCCLNKSYYSCPSSDAATACFKNSSPGDCSRDSTKDTSCN